MLNLIKTQSLIIALLTVCPCCFVDPTCYSNADCAGDRMCNVATGKCQSPECESNDDCVGDYICSSVNLCIAAPPNYCDDASDCGAGFECVDEQCRALTTLYCPKNMVSINNSYCIDRYEASKPDATSTFPGNDSSKAMSQPGVRPWQVTSNAAAQGACEAVGKSLCDETQWQIACQGPNETLYAYGDEYESATCNGIDTFCRCDDCVEGEICSYPYCYGDCGASIKPMPTGSFPDCTNKYGVYDMNGNLWEHVLNGSDMTVRGGAYNCKDSKTLHECTYIPGNWRPSARGFRCCSEGSLYPPDTDSDTDTETQS